MNIKFRYIFFVLISIIGLCTSCSEDISVHPSDGNGSGLTLRVPALNAFASRSDNGDELRYTSLFFFAFPTDNSRPTIVSLPLESNSLVFEDEYLTYTIKLPEGKFKLYLVANVYSAATDVDKLPQTEEKLKEVLFEIPDNFVCQIPEKGLPLSSSHSDFSIRRSDGTQLPVDADGYSYEGKSESLCAVLNFLFAKITVTAKDAFGYPAGLSDVRFTNLSEQEPVVFADDFLKFGQKSDISLPDPDENELPDCYNFYIPERYVASSSPESQSSIYFKIGEKQISIPLGETDGDKEDDVNSVPSVEMHRKIVRGTHYKYTLNTLLDIRLEVTDWSPEKISAKFKNPIYLHIEQQEYPVVAGEVTEVWFKSDVEDLYIESPMYHFDDEDIPLYKYEKEYSSSAEEGILKIYVNESIPTSEYEKILAETDKYDFFHIVAESIHKRIKVTPLTLEYYLNVTPLSIPIDVSTRIASSDYEGTIPITIHTNYPNLSVTLPEGSEWASIFDNNTDNAYLKFVAPAGEEVTLSAPSSISVGSSGTVVYTLSFKGLNTGSAIWENKRSLELTVVGSDDNISSEPIPVSVNIIPLVQDYVIHFKADGWSNPHIYVYECLEFPADWPGVYSPGNDKPTELLASKPLGYYAGKKENGEEIYYAALEYSFTGAIAFNGWDVPANLETLYYTNGTPRPFDGYKAQGFYIFNTDQNSWKPDLQAQAEIRYSYNMDFCVEHREAIKELCPQCANDKMNRLWPGIRMKFEGDGWWEFTLTGIATPGRTLIMFADGHGGSSVNRYPGVAEVGIPLFDYPSKEGWLRYNGDMQDRINNQFSSVKPAD